MKKANAVKVPLGIEARSEKAISKKSTRLEENDLIGPTLRFWPQEVWAMPNEMARSALFAVIRRGPRRILDEEVIASRKDGKISMSGQQLDQADADVWMQIMRIAKGYPLGTKIYINRLEILKAMHRGSGKSQYIWLEKSIDRLHKASISIDTKRYKANLHLIGDTAHDRQTGEFWISIESGAAKLFDAHTFGYVDIEKRHKLGKNDLAKWLQMYATSHSQGAEHKIGLKYLHHWCGSQGRLRAFRESTIAALAALCSAGIVEDAKIGAKSDIVSWYRPRAESMDELLAPAEPEPGLTLEMEVSEKQSA